MKNNNYQKTIKSIILYITMTFIAPHLSAMQEDCRDIDERFQVIAIVIAYKFKT